MAKIVLAMSGGVDSSVAAALLCEQGHDVVGVFMRHGIRDPAPCENTLLPVVTSPERLDHKQGCCTASDAADARRVADRLRIPFYSLNLDDEFGRIVDYFVEEYGMGRTPNPCVMCNNWIKFGKLFDYADSVDAHYVATGHYARIGMRSDQAPSLLRGRDAAKDQSYVLFGIQRDYLPRVMLPLGNYQKSEIRMMAADWNLRVADKRDSQEICFVPTGKHADFVRARRAALAGASSHSADSVMLARGEIVTTDGRCVGHHDGVEAFTIGQRKGLGVALGEPYFVVKIDARENRVVLGRREELACRGLIADRLNWLVDPPSQRFDCRAQIRYNSAPHCAEAVLVDEQTLRVEFREPCLGIAPGQAVVCYDNDRVLGGGWIRESFA